MSYNMLIDPVRFSMTNLERNSVILRAPMINLDSLLRLPDEILLEIAQLIDRKRDLLSFALTCRKLEDISTQKLYKQVDIRIPISRATQSSTCSGLPKLRPHVFRSVQELKIRSIANPTIESAHLMNRSLTGCVGDYVLDMLQRVPDHQLRSFALLSNNPLTSSMIETLTTHQADSLTALRFFEADLDGSPSVFLPKTLRTLHCRSLRTSTVLSKLVEANVETLECLHIGQEKDLLDKYRHNPMDYLTELSQLQPPLDFVADLGRLCRLQHLKLCGLDLEPFLPQSTQSSACLGRLETLSLESCGSSAQFLDALSIFFRHIEPATTQRSLKSFTIRQEAVSRNLKDALIRFLSSFAGLEKLALLFENTTLSERPSTFIAGHGIFLKHLTIETRMQPREHLGVDTSRPFGIGGNALHLWQESVDDLSDLCPNLEEVGLAFSWDDEMVRMKKSKLAKLRHLRTIHVRNFPQTQELSQVGDYAIQEYARRFIEFCFQPLLGSTRPALETLVIGPTLYENRWNYNSSGTESSQSSNGPRQHSNPPEYLRSHYFCLDWAETRFQRWNAMITPVSEKFMEELRDQRPLEGIFEHVWLR